MFIPCIPRPQKVVFFEGTTPITDVRYTLDPTIPKEGYKIVARDRLNVYYANEIGLDYAKRTLQSFANYYGENIPQLEIEDQPRLAFRGLMLDVGRYFYPVEDVKKILDYMAELKLNVFHWHLTEDQGWRIESEKYPLLTTIGAVRSHTNWDCRPHGGYYTKAQLKEVVQYAHQKHIIVIPEIDMPGHMRAAIAAYPELACMPRKLPVASHVGVKYDILCGGKESVYTFVKDIVEEFSEIFTDGYFHLGGDEAFKERWQHCPDCQKAIKELGLKDEDQLQTHFMNRIVREVLLPKEVTPIMWQCGDSPEGLDPHVVLQYYEGRQSTFETAYTLINSNSAYLYLDFPYSLSTLANSYTVHQDPNTAVAMGMEACVWTEFIKDIKCAEYMMFPRLLALAENMWGSQDDYWEFVSRAQYFYDVHDSKNFRKISKASPKHCLRSIHWQHIRPLYWEGLRNRIDNAKVAKMFRKKVNQ